MVDWFLFMSNEIILIIEVLFPELSLMLFYKKDNVIDYRDSDF